MRRILKVAVAVTCVGQLLACAADPESEEPTSELTAVSDSLIGVSGDFWKNYPAPNSLPWVQACWVSASMASKYDGLRSTVQLVIARAWERWARLNVVWSPTACPTTQLDGTVTFAFTTDPTIGGKCVGTPFKRQITLNQLLMAGGTVSPPSHWVSAYGSNASNMLIQYWALHEMAHCIGYDHGEKMPPPNGPPNPACTLVATGAAETEVDQPSQARFGAYNMFESKITVCADNQPLTFTPALLPVDIAAHQRAYGRRIPGSLVSPAGQCAASVASASGDPAFIYDCDEFADDQEWEWIPRDIDDAMIRVRSTNLCLRAASTGGDATVTTCNVNSSTQRWKMRNVTVRGWGGQCLHLEGGNTNGGLVTSRRCSGSDPNQRWTFWYEIGNGFGRLRFGDGSTGKCLNLGTTNGSQATVVSCATTAAQIFYFDPATHQIKRTGTGINKCLDVQAVLDSDYTLGIGEPGDGAKVQAFDCLTAQYNQKWNFNGPILHSASGKCLNRANATPGSAMTVSTCGTSTGDGISDWDYYQRTLQEF